MVGSKTALLLANPRCMSKVSFQRNGCGVVLKFFANYLKGLTAFSIHREHSLFLREYGENFNTMPEFFL